MSLVSGGVRFFEFWLYRPVAHQWTCVSWGAIFSWVQKCREPLCTLDHLILVGTGWRATIKQRCSFGGNVGVRRLQEESTNLTPRNTRGSSRSPTDPRGVGWFFEMVDVDARLVSLCSTSQGHLEFTTGFAGTWFLMIFVLPQHLFVTITTLNPSRDAQNTRIFQRAYIFPRTHHVRRVCTLWKGQLWISSSNTHRKEI